MIASDVALMVALLMLVLARWARGIPTGDVRSFNNLSYERFDNARPAQRHLPHAAQAHPKTGPASEPQMAGVVVQSMTSEAR